MGLEYDIERLVRDEVAALNRPDLFRSPLVSFSAADDARYPALKTIIGDWHKLPTELLADAVSVISYFVPFTKEVTAEPKSVRHGSFLWCEAYEEVNRHFVQVNEKLIAFLKGLGHSASAISPTHTYDPRDLKCFWSHRSAAVIAGLGTFGANRLVITPKGSGGRFCTVITSAPLPVTLEPAKDRCLYQTRGSCGLCFKICPVKALNPDSMDKFVCQNELNKNEALIRQTTHLTNTDTCGKCISVCPLSYIE